MICIITQIYFQKSLGMSHLFKQIVPPQIHTIGWASIALGWLGYSNVLKAPQSKNVYIYVLILDDGSSF